MSALTPGEEPWAVPLFSARVYAKQMAQFEYSVWFKDREAHPTDQDYEWVACFLINATTTKDAKDWGDLLSRDFAARNGSNEFLSSSVSPIDPDEASSELPKVKFGERVSDELIGW